MGQPPDVSIVIPCYNEARRIGPSLRRLDTFLRTRPEAYEVLVCNDGSTDDTADIVRSFQADMPVLKLLEAPSNEGKGAGVRRGMLAASGRLVLFTDADLATPPEEIPRLLEALETAPVAIGIRVHPDGTDMRTASQPPHRRFLGKVFTLLTALLVLPGFPDTQCGFKGFHREAAQAIFSRLSTRGIVFDVEVLALARLLGYTIRQVPIQWREPGGSVMRVRAQKAWEVAGELLAIRRRLQSLKRELAQPRS